MSSVIEPHEPVEPHEPEPRRPVDAREPPPRRTTSAALSIGAAIGAACFIVAMLAEQVGVADPGVEAIDVVGVLSALPAFEPSAWATLGIYAIVATPIVGLVATAWEFAAVDDRRTVVTAGGVLLVLAVSLVVAAIR